MHLGRTPEPPEGLAEKEDIAVSIRKADHIDHAGRVADQVGDAVAVPSKDANNLGRVKVDHPQPEVVRGTCDEVALTVDRQHGDRGAHSVVLLERASVEVPHLGVLRTGAGASRSVALSTVSVRTRCCRRHGGGNARRTLTVPSSDVDTIRRFTASTASAVTALVWPVYVRRRWPD